MEEEPKEPSNGQRLINIGAFILTIIALPVLFVGTCVPIGLASMRGNIYSTDVTAAVTVGIYTVVFFGLFGWLATRAKNSGVRSGIVTVLIIGAILFIYVLSSLR